MPRRYKFNKTHTWTKYTHLHKNIFNVFFFVFLCVARFVLKNVIGLKRNFLIYFSTHYTGLWMRLKNKFGWWLSEFIEKFYILKLSKLLSRQGLLQGSFGWFAFGGGGGTSYLHFVLYLERCVSEVNYEIWLRTPAS